MNAAEIATVCWDRHLRLEGADIFLRPVTEEDVGDHYVAWLVDPAINAYLETRWQEQDRASILDFVRQQSQHAAVLLMAIMEKKSGKHIGNIKLGPINVHHLCGDISYFIGDREAWGKGYATQAIRLLVACGFSRLGLHRIQAGCYAENIGSAKALKKVGFAPEGVWRKHVLDAQGQWQDHLWFGLLREDWVAP